MAPDKVKKRKVLKKEYEEIFAWMEKQTFMVAIFTNKWLDNGKFAVLVNHQHQAEGAPTLLDAFKEAMKR